MPLLISLSPYLREIGLRLIENLPDQGCFAPKESLRLEFKIIQSRLEYVFLKECAVLADKNLYSVDGEFVFLISHRFFLALPRAL